VNRRGFTLLEILIAITIIGILLAIGVPRFNDQLKKASIEGQVRELSVDLMQARATALTQHATISVFLAPTSFTGPGISKSFIYPVTWQGKGAGDSQIQIDFDQRGSFDVTNNGGLAICVSPSMPDARLDSVVLLAVGNHVGKRAPGGDCASSNITVQ